MCVCLDGVELRHWFQRFRLAFAARPGETTAITSTPTDRAGQREGERREKTKDAAQLPAPAPSPKKRRSSVRVPPPAVSSSTSPSSSLISRDGGESLEWRERKWR